MRLFLIAALFSALAACGVAPRQQAGDILVIGDSVFAWNRSSGQDVGRVIEMELNRDVTSRARLGAQLQSGRLASLGGLSIPDQLTTGSWSWVVMNGGANDLARACGCQRCDGVIDQLIGPDAMTGAIPDLISRARNQGAQVIWAGYYEAPASRSFAGCHPWLVTLEQRIARYAAAKPGVYFMDIEDVIDATASHLLAPDRTHPNSTGSAVIGRFIATRIIAES